MEQRPQLKLGPRYRAVTLLAKGGMGAVYLGHKLDASSGRPAELVAIKVMHGYIADRADTVAMFIDEARIGTRIDHPNVVRVLDTDVAEDTPFIVMEYVEGLSLSRLLSNALPATEADLEATRKTPLPVDVVARVVHDALLGLSAAHAIGAVHRDVSPDNVLVGVDGRARITDFGVATFAGRLAATMPGQVRGKLGYMSPEQLTRSGVDERSDVFSMGVVLWESLTGRDLFAGPTQAETIANVLGLAIPPPSQHVDVPPPLEDACLRALERGKDRRFASADAFARAIADAVPLATAERVAAVVREADADGLAQQRDARDALSLSIFDVLDDPAARPTEPPPVDGVERLSLTEQTETIVRVDAPRSAAAQPSHGASRWLLVASGAAMFVAAGVVAGGIPWRRAPAPAASAASSATAVPSGVATRIDPAASSSASDEVPVVAPAPPATQGSPVRPGRPSASGQPSSSSRAPAHRRTAAPFVPKDL